MNKKVLVTMIMIAGAALFGGGVFAYANTQNDKNEQAKTENEIKTNDNVAAKNNETMTAEADKARDDTMGTHGAYVTSASYYSESAKYADTKRVFFFHASWCSICQAIDKALKADSSVIPSGVTLIKIDFDSEIDLRKKYGVTTQYTFVQVDKDDNEIAKWSATSLEKAIDGIQL